MQPNSSQGSIHSSQETLSKTFSLSPSKTKKGGQDSILKPQHLTSPPSPLPRKAHILLPPLHATVSPHILSTTRKQQLLHSISMPRPPTPSPLFMPSSKHSGEKNPVHAKSASFPWPNKTHREATCSFSLEPHVTLNTIITALYASSNLHAREPAFARLSSMQTDHLALLLKPRSASNSPRKSARAAHRTDLPLYTHEELASLSSRPSPSVQPPTH